MPNSSFFLCVNQLVKTVDLQCCFSGFERFNDFNLMIEFLFCLSEDDIFFTLRNHNDTVTVAENDIARIDLNTTAVHRHIEFCETLLDGPGRVEAAAEYR